MIKLKNLERKKGLDNKYNLIQKIKMELRQKNNERTSVKDFLFKEMKI